jgi:hypothetical protein
MTARLLLKGNMAHLSLSTVLEITFATNVEHNLSRAVIEASIAKTGFQLWRMKK